MKLGSLTVSVLIFTLNFSICLAQKGDSIIYLGDRIELSKHDYDKLNLEYKSKLKKVVEKDSFFTTIAEGTLVIGNTKVTVIDPLKDGITKILVIGNSFSDDGVESYLYEMARSVGKPLIIGNLFRGGAALEFHLKNAREDNKIYSYRRTSIDGIKSNTDKTSILEALKDENWDFICFQQASVTSGNWESVEASLPSLFDYVRTNYKVPTVKFLYHQTWAYAQNASTANFEKYNRNQSFMFERIVDVSKRVSSLIPLYKLVPSGTAIQNGRTTYYGDNFTREGYHLDLAYGRFTAASTWFETIFGDVKNISYQPNYLSLEDVAIAKEAAITAVKKPFEVTTLSKYVKQNLAQSPFSTIKINFGSDLLIAGWISLLYEKAGSGRYGMMDENNNRTDVGLRIMQNFDLRKAEGISVTSFAMGIPAQISKSYFEVKINTINQENPFLRIEKLNPAKKYRLNIISTDKESTSNIRFYAKGKSMQELSLTPYFNRSKEIIFDKIVPDKNGDIDLGFRLDAGESETRTVINALVISEIK